MDVFEALHKNWQRRNRAEHELEEAREELRALFANGKAQGLKVAPMAREARVSRDTAHTLLREAKAGDDA
jgi:hypothetical protein